MNASIAYIAKSISLWYARLCHVNIVSVKRFEQLSLILGFSSCDFDKCEICVEAEHPKKTFNRNVSCTST